jgi:hypothetical protein
MSRQYEKHIQEVPVLKSITCDICGHKVCDHDHLMPLDNVATLSASFGYGSKYDTENHECDMCVACYDRVRKYIEESMLGKVRISGPYVEVDEFWEERNNRYLEEEFDDEDYDSNLDKTHSSRDIRGVK